MNIISIFLFLGVLAATSSSSANCGPVPPGMKQDTKCQLTSDIPPSLGNDLVAEGSIESITCEKLQKKNGIYRAILKIDKVNTGPSAGTVNFIFEHPKGPSVLVGDKGEFTLKRKKLDWFLVSKIGSVFSGGMLPVCK